MRVRSIQRWAPPLVVAGAGLLVTVMAPAEGVLPSTVEHRGHLYTASGEGPLDVPASSAGPLDEPASGGGAPASASTSPQGNDGSPAYVSDPLAACFWIMSPPCTLGGAKASMCVMTAACPAGTRVLSGGCEGFASIAIGRSAPTLFLTGWTCAASRLFDIKNANLITADALCCPY